MAFDNPERDDGWKEIIEEMSKTMVQMAESIAELRQAMAPLLERHRWQEEQRLKAEERDRMFLQAQERLAAQYAVQTTQLYGVVCDCSPTREAYLNNSLTDRINKFFGN